MTLQFIFFDGEEAFKTWTDTDSIYGARHLAESLHNTTYSYNGIEGKQIERIDILVLLDLLGAKDPNIYSTQFSSEVVDSLCVLWPIFAL